MLRVLTYHRVANAADTPSMDPALISATPEVFREQMLHVRRRYRPVGLEDVLRAFLRGASLPPRALHVTFDDAYRDFAQTAWPVLRDLGIPVTVFVATEYPGNPSRMFWWDRLHQAIKREDGYAPGGKQVKEALRSLPHDETERFVDRICREAGAAPPPGPGPGTVLDWDELRALGREGVEFGAHTRGHVALPHVDEQRMRDEIRGSLQEVRDRLGYRAPTLAYPYGLNNAVVRRVAREEGCALAFTVEDGLNDPGRTDPMALRRTNITTRTSPALFALRMLPWFAHVDRWRHRGERAQPMTQDSTAAHI